MECGLGAKATNLLVNVVRQEGARNVLYGAKITGRGAGGTVAILGQCDAGKIQESQPRVFKGSSNSADIFGIVEI